jgi:hypothetical protein
VPPTDLVLAIDEIRLVDTHEHLRSEREWVEDGPDSDIDGRFAGIRDAWEAMQHTGYGEAVRLIASEIHGLDELTPDGLRRADRTLRELRQPGERLRLLSETARLDRVQIDHGEGRHPKTSRSSSTTSRGRASARERSSPRRS